MFIIINRIGDSITGSINGESFGVSFTEEKYKALKEVAEKANSVETMEELTPLLEEARGLTAETFKEVVEHKTPYLYVNKATGQFFLKVGTGDDSRVSNQPLPAAFVDRIVQSIEKGVDILPLVKAWQRFLRNPFYSAAKAQRFANYINRTYTDYEKVKELVEKHGVSPDVAQERATGYQTPITQEGLICTYKVSAELTKRWVLDAEGNKKQVSLFSKNIDEITGEVTEVKPDHVEDRIFYPAVQGLQGGDAFYCGGVLGHIIRVGQRHRLESWDQVNTNDSQSCVKGLHCGNLDYIRGYQTSGTETHNVFVDPAFIGAFTDDGSGAIRVLEYFVHSSFAGVNRGIYHSSKYAAQTDAQYAQDFEAAVARFEESEEDRLARLNEGKALLSI